MTEKKSKTPPKSRRMPRGEVYVFDNWCKGCGLCIEFCPTKVLEPNGEGHPIVAHPERCTACRWCELHCPDFAIMVLDIKRDSEESGNGRTETDAG